MTDQQYPAPPQKKKSPWGCILIGCGVALVLAIIGVVALVGFGWYKAKQMGFDPKEWSENPTKAAAKMVTVMNPEVEVVETDEDAQTITLRNKETGETITIDMEDIKQGKLKFFNEEGEAAEITVTTDEEGSGTLNISSSEGDFTMDAGAGVAKLPDWVPVFGGGVPENVGVLTAGSGITGGYTVETGESLEDTAAFFEDKLKAAGFETSRSSFTSNETSVINIRGLDEPSGRSVIVMVTDEGGKVTANITFAKENN